MEGVGFTRFSDFSSSVCLFPSTSFIPDGISGRNNAEDPSLHLKVDEFCEYNDLFSRGVMSLPLSAFWELEVGRVTDSKIVRSSEFSEGSEFAFLNWNLREEALSGLKVICSSSVKCSVAIGCWTLSSACNSDSDDDGAGGEGGEGRVGRRDRR